MYASDTLIQDVGPDTARSFLRSCTSSRPTPTMITLVECLTDALRSALSSNDLTSLRDVIRHARTRDTELHDAFAAAQQCLVDELLDGPIAAMHANYRRMLEIAHAVLPRVALAA